jgi:molybdopterin-containing oxidoreductase family membrane subunit
MSSHYEATIRKPLVIGDKSYHDVTVDVAAPVEGKANKHWWIVFSIALTAFLWGSLYNLHRINRNRNMGIK